MNNDLNLLSNVSIEDKDNEVLSNDKTSKDDLYCRQFSIIRLILSSSTLNNNLENNQAPNVIKLGCTCLAIKVCGKTLGSIVNPILSRSFSKILGGKEL